jgi:hypothetical protein
MSEKSHVGMLNCWICDECAEIVLNRRLTATLDKNLGSSPNIICSKCKSMAKDNDGIWLISIKNGVEPSSEDTNQTWNPYRTGQLILIKKEALKEIIKSKGKKKDKTLKLIDNSVYFYLNDDVWDLIGLPRDKNINNLKTPSNE